MEPSPYLPEVDVKPLDDMMLDFLIDHDSEEPYLDFKETMDVSKNYPFSEHAKDFMAFMNYGGGYIFIGFRHRSKFSEDIQRKWKRQFVPIGLPQTFNIDQATLQEKFNSYIIHPVTTDYREFHRQFEGELRKFAVAHFPASSEVIKAAKTGAYKDGFGKNHLPFKAGAILFRRGTQSVLATKSEQMFIQRRIQDTQYRLSVVSGFPDHITESITSNLFEATYIDRKIYVAPEAEVRSSIEQAGIALPYPVGVVWNDSVVSFENLGAQMRPMQSSLTSRVVQQYSLDEWMGNPEKSRVITWLLNEEFHNLAQRIGLMRIEGDDRLYFQCVGDSRRESWVSRFRGESSLLVAKKSYVAKLKRTMYIHLAVRAGFLHLGGRTFLGLYPTLILTTNGTNPSIGEREGAILTSLLHDKYNQAFFNDVLFWIHQLSNKKDSFELAHGKVVVSSKPVTSSIPIGILSDRPASEEVPEYLGEKSAS